MAGRIVSGMYNEADFQTVVCKESKYGLFSGVTMAAPEDWDIANKWDGKDFAEYLADVKQYKEKAKWMRERAIGIENAYKAMAQSIDEDNPVMQKLKRQVNIAKRDAEACKETYECMRDSYKPYTDMKLKRRREVRKKIEEKYGN